MADGAAEEDAVGEVGDLEGHDWGGMSGVTDFVVEGEELFEDWRDIGRRRRRRRGEEVCDGDIGGGDVDEVDAGVVACDVDVSVGVGFETAGEGREEREGLGKSVFEVRDESGRGK